MRVVVKPDSGYLYNGAVFVGNSISEVADHHYGQNHMGSFASASPDSNYGDPYSNVAVLQSDYLFLPHNATYRLWVKVSYQVVPPYPAGSPIEEEAEMFITLRNMELVDNRPEPYFVWKPLEVAPPPQPRTGLNGIDPEPIPIGVPFSVEVKSVQSGTCTLTLEIFPSKDNEHPILVKQFENVPRPSTWEWTWDGKLDDGSTAPRGIYTYRLRAQAPIRTWTDGDDSRSAYLHIGRAYNENN